MPPDITRTRDQLADLLQEHDHATRAALVELAHATTHHEGFDHHHLHDLLHRVQSIEARLRAILWSDRHLILQALFHDPAAP